MGSGLLQVWGALSAAVNAWHLLKEVTIIFISSTIVWSNNREGAQPRPSTENRIKDLLSMAPPIRTNAVSPSVSLSHQEASVCLLSSGRSGGVVAKSCPTLATPWTVACLALLSVGFSRQEYWSGLPFSYPPSEGKQTENHNHRKLTNLITWTTAFSNLMKL